MFGMRPTNGVCIIPHRADAADVKASVGHDAARDRSRIVNDGSRQTAYRVVAALKQECFCLLCSARIALIRPRRIVPGPVGVVAKTGFIHQRRAQSRRAIQRKDNGAAKNTSVQSAIPRCCTGADVIVHLVAPLHADAVASIEIVVELQVYGLAIVLLGSGIGDTKL